MNVPVLIARLAGKRIAIPAKRIESIVDIDHVTPVPQAPAHVEGLSTLRSQTLTVINCTRVVDETNPALAGGGARAAVVMVGGHGYALMLDSVEDVVLALTEPEDVLGGVGASWTPVALGMIETESGAALLVEVERFINTPALAG